MSKLDPVQIAALDFARAPRGAGSLDRDGYRMIGVKRFYEAEHRIVWKRHKGPIPKGMHIHHKDDNKLNNDIDNLELIDPITHRRLHCGHTLVDGVWHKPCRACGAVLPYEAFYEKPDKNGPSRHWCCKPCYNKKVVERRRGKK